MKIHSVHYANNTFVKSTINTKNSQTKAKNTSFGYIAPDAVLTLRMLPDRAFLKKTPYLEAFWYLNERQDIFINGADSFNFVESDILGPETEKIITVDGRPGVFYTIQNAPFKYPYGFLVPMQKFNCFELSTKEQFYVFAQALKRADECKKILDSDDPKDAAKKKELLATAERNYNRYVNKFKREVSPGHHSDNNMEVYHTDFAQ